MPSGAKKRKAAKKKKESGAPSNPSSNNPPVLGVEDVKAQDSDGSEISTPASKDRDSHQSPFDVGGEELEKGVSSSVGSFAAESKSVEGAAGNGDGAQGVESEGEGVVEVDRELYSQANVESETVSFEHVQSSKGSHAKNDTSSSSSSSDDESQADEEKGKDKTSNSAMEVPSYTDLVSKGESQFREEPTMEEVFNSILANASVSEEVKPAVTVSEEVICVEESVPVQSSVASDLAASVLKENGENLLPKPDGLTGAPPAEVDSESKNVESQVLPLLNKNGVASSDAVKFVPEESKGKVVSSSRGYNDENGNGAEHTKKSEIPQYPENEHLLPVAPRPVQTTSWKGCCGLFEVLTGSGR